MSKSNTRSFITHLFVFVVSLALVGADLVVLGQNTNSSTTMQNDNMSAGNTNMGGGRRRRSSRRRGRRRRSSAGMSNANAACGPMQENTNMAGGTQENANMGEATGNMSTGGGRRRRRGRRRSSSMGFPAGQTSTDLQNAEAERTVGRPEDLSGTYSGNITVTGGHEMSGPATITINNDQVTIEGEGMTHTGRISAVTTRGYTGATLYFPDVKDAATNTPLGISVRARHSGNSLTLTPLANVRNGISFTTGGGKMGGGGRRGRRGRRRRGTSGSMTGNACDTTTTGDTSGNMNSATPSDTSADTTNTNMAGGNMGGRRRRGGRRRGGRGNMNGNTNTSGNTNTTP
ncbi:MAG: hypothetical protein QOH63_1057 [Acidobacteriota bacterium]|nr:hypothetical protein [Acidobacteriota bacterium]